MKKLLAILLASTMLCSLAACGSKEQEAVSDSEPALNQQEEKENILCPGAPARSGSMLHVFDALIMAMTENDMTYDPEDPAAFWTELAYLIGLDGAESKEAYQNKQDNLVLPAEAVKEFAAAMFIAYDPEEDLPEMPRDDMMLRYNGVKDTYTLQPGDFGLTETQVTNCKDEGNGVYTISADFVSTDDQTVISRWEIVIVENLQAKDDGLYDYRVADIQCVEETEQSDKTKVDVNTASDTYQTQQKETITLDDAVDVLYSIGAEDMNLDRSLEDCFISPDGSTASIEGHTCYAINVYEDVSQENLLGSYYVCTDGKLAYAYNNITNEYNLIY